MAKILQRDHPIPMRSKQSYKFNSLVGEKLCATKTSCSYTRGTNVQMLLRRKYKGNIIGIRNIVA
ncbi:CLUMA_CG000318, isoform A [Clunio marinus]|uniref:CLUMA_CG000318, isoform A n=1 Tax=Clunio marinus TaxID=568069 RepID=A0A1J1HJC1_9DIPT|nr:CLUMA_CG000318, isoform A [Clunio marinus]